MSNTTTVSLSANVSRADFIRIDRLAKRRGMTRSSFVASLLHALPEIASENVSDEELDEFNRLYSDIVPKRKRKHKLRWYQRMFS